jgi:hypothetical protein
MIALTGAEVKPLGVGALGKTCNNHFPASRPWAIPPPGHFRCWGSERTLPESRETSPFDPNPTLERTEKSGPPRQEMIAKDLTERRAAGSDLFA